MKLALSLLTLSATLYALNYEGCSDTKQNALFALSGNIKSNIQSNFEENIKSSSSSSSDESIKTTISSYLNASTNLSLVNISYERKNGSEICAYVKSEDQTKNTKKLLSKALLYEEVNLPKDIDEKMKMLTMWLKDIKELGYLLPVFVQNSTIAQEKLNKKEKKFQDLYTDTLIKSDSLVWRSCEDTKEQAKNALNKKLFINNGKEEEKSFFSSIVSFFNSDDSNLINNFDSQITYLQKENKECAVIKKDQLLLIANSMNNDVKRFNIRQLDKNPAKRYKQIDNYVEYLEITKALLKLYPDIFTKKDFDNIINVNKKLVDIKAVTYPQYVLFHIKGEQKIAIKVDNKIIQNNIKHYIINGEHTYSISTKDKCSIDGTFNIDLFENEEITEDFSSKNYPTVLFITDKSPHIVVNGQIIKPNISTSIKKCDSTVRYMVKFAGQNKSGEFELSPDSSYTVELNFLSPEELEIFNNTKTKYFNVQSDTKYSDSLTSIYSDNLEFILDEDVQNGDLDLNENGSFKYISKENFVGTDSFEYVIKANGKTSSSKIVNITINQSDAPAVVESKKDTKQTQKADEEVKKVQKPKTPTEDKNKELKTPVEDKVKEVKKEIKEGVKTVEKKSKEYIKEAQERYNRFKAYVNSQEQNIEKLKKLQKKYPKMFKRLLEEKLNKK